MLKEYLNSEAGSVNMAAKLRTLDELENVKITRKKHLFSTVLGYILLALCLKSTHAFFSMMNNGYLFTKYSTSTMIKDTYGIPFEHDFL